jgi:hypothetical protein
MADLTSREKRDIANSRMPIDAAVRLVGGEAWAGNGKQWCPFGAVSHMDGGQDRAFRIYPEENTAFCFGGCGFFTPTKMVAVGKDMNEDDAADYILEVTGYRPPTVEKRWEAATTVKQAIDTDALAEALRVFCTRLDKNFDVSRYDEPIASTFRKCLALTDRVTSAEDATLWLRTTKEAMRQVLS